MNNSVIFKGFIPKNSLSQDTFDRSTKKIQEYKKFSQSMLEYYHIIHKNIQIYYTFLSKQVQSIEPFIKQEPTQEKIFFIQLAVLFKIISNSYNTFLNNFSSNLKQYHANTETQFQQLTNQHFHLSYKKFGNYKNNQLQLIELSKKYSKSIKTVSQNIMSYKTSFSDVKLIYNKNQKVKRYKILVDSYNNLVAQENNLKIKAQKSNDSKQQCITEYNILVEQFQKLIKFLNQKIIFQTKNLLNLFCSAHKNLINEISARKKVFQESRIHSFFQVVFDPPNIKLCILQEQVNSQQPNQIPYFLKTYKNIKQQNIFQYGKWLQQYNNHLKQKYQVNKKAFKKIYSFLADLTKCIEKMSTTLIKQMPNLLEKLKKKNIQLFGTKNFDYLKGINASMDMSMRIYEKLIKVFNLKLGNIDNVINEDQKLADMFFKQLTKQINDHINNRKSSETDISQQNKKQIRSSIKTKSEIIKHFIMTFHQKISKNLELMKSEIILIVNQIYSLSNQVYLYSTQYQDMYFGNQFEQGINRCKKELNKIIEKDKIILDFIPTQILKQPIQIDQNQKFKHDEFIKIRPSFEQDNELSLIQQQQAQVILPVSNNGTPNKLKSSFSQQSNVIPKYDEKQVKNYLFLTKNNNINFQEGQILLKTFSCGLADKIILQGRMFISNVRIFFHSYFNVNNVLMGTTFLEVPKNDIKKIEKRMNAIIFDNSIAITTVNGQMFFTSFRKRDEAYDFLIKTFSIVSEQKFYLDPKEIEIIKDKQDKKAIQKSDLDKLESNVQKNLEIEQKKEKQQQLIKQQHPSQSVQDKIQMPIEQSDSISPQQQLERKQKFSQLWELKRSPIVTKTIPNTTCLFILKNFYSQHSITIKGKKYECFMKYYKQNHLNEFNIKIDKWTPDFMQFLNSNNIKYNTPLKFKHKIVCNHPITTTSIPFLPKFTTTTQDHTLYIISKNQFIIEKKIDSVGAPYTDYFTAYIRQEYTNKGNNVQIVFSLLIEFVKYTIMKKTIQTTFHKQFNQGSILFAKIINERLKLDLQKQKKVKQINNLIKKEQIKVEENIKQHKEQQQKILVISDNKEDRIEEIPSMNQSLDVSVQNQEVAVLKDKITVLETEKKIATQQKQLYLKLLIISIVLNCLLILFK